MRGEMGGVTLPSLAFVVLALIIHGADTPGVPPNPAGEEMAPRAFVAPAEPPTIVRKNLTGGPRLIVAEKPESSLVALEIRVRGAGTDTETPENNGVAHAIEHMVFKGSMLRPPGSYDAEIERFVRGHPSS